MTIVPITYNQSIGSMPMGTWFTFRGSHYMRVAGPWEDGQFPTLEWFTNDEHTTKNYALAVSLRSGCLVPFAKGQMGTLVKKRLERHEHQGTPTMPESP